MLLDNGRTGILTLEDDTTLHFSHVSIPQKLQIKTGASAIQWNYNLNINVIPTMGGEVGQVLSAFVDAITITGQTSNNDQLKSIYEWFLQYMQLAGLNRREQQAVKFEYPERGWVFYIQPRLAQQFEYNRDKVALPWTIVAEIVADNDINYLSSYTMSVMGEAVTFDSNLYDIGFNVEQPDLQPDFGATLSENFQALLGSWATGDFAHWGFDVTQGPTNNALKTNSAEIFDNAFGSDFITGAKQSATGSGITGSATYNGPQNPTSQSDILNDIYSSCNARGTVPGVLGITIALIETGNPSSTDPGVDPNSPGTNRPPGSHFGLFQTNSSGAGGGTNHSSEVRAVELHPGDPVTKWYPSGDQIADFVEWSARATKPAGAGQNSDASVMQRWAINIQGVGSNLAGNPRYGNLSEFTQFFNAAQNIAAGFSVTSFANPQRSAIVASAHNGLHQAQPYVFGGARPMSKWPKGFYPPTDCSGFVELAYRYGTNGDTKLDPMGTGNRYTEAQSLAMADSNNAVKIDLQSVKAADLVVYGSEHVAIFVEDYHGPSTTIISNGGPGPAHTISISSENAGFSITPTYVTYFHQAAN